MFRRKRLPIVILSLFAGGIPHATQAQQSSTGVAATVNESVISNYDLDQRTALFVATSGVRPTAESMPQIRAQVLRALIDETIEMQEAGKRRIGASQAEIQKALQNIASDNKLTPDQILATLNQAGVTTMTFIRQLSSQVIWQKLVAARYGTDVLVGDQQVDEAMARLRQGADKPQFLISEIYVGVDRPEEETNIKASAEQIAQQVKQGAPFSSIANQFSQSPSAADGGDIGWIVQGQLADEIDQALLTLRPGQVVGPIRAEGGYYILMLRDRREPVSANAGANPLPVQAVAPPPDPNAPVSLDRLLLPLPPDADAVLKDRTMTLANAASSQARSCADLPAVAGRVTGSVYQRLGTLDPKDLAPELRAALAKSKPGEALPPFFSPAGVEVIVRCDGAPAPLDTVALPTRDELRQQLYVQQMTIYAKSYLGELRRSAAVYMTGR